MKKLAMTTVAALLLATPVMAQNYASDEPAGIAAWQELVAKANADRLGHRGGDVAAIQGTVATDAGQPRPTAVLAQNYATDEPAGIAAWQELVAKASADRLAHRGGDVAAIKGTTATDASQAPAAAAPVKAQPTTGRYQSMADYWQDRS